ncbi:MAG TPA: chemotaxis protein CheA [Thermodesulfobacteriota bacterium]
MTDAGQPDLTGLYGEFLDESRELLDAVARDLVLLEQRPDDRDVLHRVFRAAHSLKGNAGFMGMETLATLAHSMENVLGRVRDGSLASGPDLLDLLLRGLDACRMLLASAAPGQPGGDAGRLTAELESLLARFEALHAGAGEAAAAPAAGWSRGAPDDPAVAAGAEPAPADRAAADGRRGRDGDTIRVSTARLDRLVNLVGELMASRSQLASLSRRTHHRELEDVAAGLSRLADQLQGEVLSIRMVPIRTLFQKFHRLVRDTAREAGKPVVLELEGEATELDKAIVEAVHDPVVHLVRNAIGHGIEPAEARAAAGKPATGRVRLAARHAQDHVVIEVSDDGRGIDEASVRRRAAERGLLSAADAEAPLTPEAVRRLIFSPGFSTADRVDRISGRGVGLDVVRTAVEGLGGTVELATQVGQGTTFTLRVPLTLAMIQIFLVRVAGRLYGLPLTYVEETIRVAPREFQIVGHQRVHLLRGQAIPVMPLALPLGAPESGALPDTAPVPVVVVRHGDRRVGFLVDEVCGKDKTVLKALGPYLARLPQPVRGIAGASLLGSGELVLIADVLGLLALAGDMAAA